MADVYVLCPQKFMRYFFESNLGVSPNRFAGAIAAQSRGADLLIGVLHASSAIIATAIGVLSHDIAQEVGFKAAVARCG